MTHCSESSAQKYLKSTRYNVEMAVDAYLRKHSGAAGQGGPRVDTKQLERIFVKYADGEDEIGIEGTMQYLEDLGMGLDEVGVLGLAMELGAPTQGIFTRAGFIGGWQALRISSLEGMKQHAATLTPALTTASLVEKDDQASDLFKKTYLHTFTFALTPPSRTLPLDSAVVFWDLLLGPSEDGGGVSKFARLDQWKRFVTEKGRGISRDVWNLLYDFIHTVRPDLSDYDEAEAWPVMIDEFVAWAKKDDGLN